MLPAKLRIRERSPGHWVAEIDGNEVAEGRTFREVADQVKDVRIEGARSDGSSGFELQTMRINIGKKKHT